MSSSTIYIQNYNIPGYPGYKLTEDFNIIGKNGNILSICNNGKNPKTSHKYVNVYVNKKSAILYIHRAVALVHVNGYFDGAYVDHIDDNPTNNNPKNLRWITPKGNMHHNKHFDIESTKIKIKYHEEQLAYYNNRLKTYGEVSSRNL